MGLWLLVGLIVVEVIIFALAGRLKESGRHWLVFIGWSLFLNYAYLLLVGKGAFSDFWPTELGFLKTWIAFFFSFIFWRRSRQSKSDLGEYFWLALAAVALLVTIILLFAH